MIKKSEYLKTFILATCAGSCIGIGGTVYLLCPNKLIGAFLFSVGLITILLFRLKLFTGMTGYLFDEAHKFNYILKLIIVWFGNFCGTFLVGTAIRSSRLASTAVPTAQAIITTKLTDTWYSLIILGIFCGMLMYIGVDSFKKSSNQYSTLSTITPILCVATFIIAGFEHCIADMYYFTVAGPSWSSLLALIFITTGNIIGSFVIPMTGVLIRRLSNE